jgi:pSer/pThr/pTyr-binding forkhead associated (FHA) protein
MDDPRTPGQDGGHPLQGPHWLQSCSQPPPADFFPLRLVLQPSGMIVEFTRPDMLLGRHSDADVRLPLPDVSRRHCRFTFSSNRWQVLDLNSLNGVFVNGERVQQATLRAGDAVRIGGFTFTVDLPTGGETVQLGGEERANKDDILRSIADALPRPSDNDAQRRAS